MKTYYKATRPDGTDFYSGTVDYAAALESGKPIARKPALDSYECCSDDVYRASNTPSETLIGGSWPCRLFEVNGRPVDQDGHKFGFRSLRVVREIEAWRALGPNGQGVAEVIERIREMTLDELKRTGYAAVSAARYAARDAARYAARDAARYAACAFVVRDLITDEQFRLLAGPLLSVIGEDWDGQVHGPGRHVRRQRHHQSWRGQTYSRTGRKLYVVAPFRHIYDNWCIDHRLNPRSNFLVAVVPTRPYILRGQRGIDYTVAPYCDLVLDRTVWSRLEALLNEMRNHVQGNRIDDVEAWLEENLI